MRRLIWGVVALVGLALLVLLVQAIRVDHWIFHPIGGTCQGAHCKGYLFWSGIAGTVIFSTGLYGGILLFARKHNCHVKGCPRLGRYHVNGTPFVVCKPHHPKVPNEGVTVEHVAECHEEAAAQIPDLREAHRQHDELLRQGNEALEDLRVVTQELRGRPRA